MAKKKAEEAPKEEPKEAAVKKEDFNDYGDFVAAKRKAEAKQK